jgi:hypothetical protein
MDKVQKTFSSQYYHSLSKIKPPVLSLWQKEYFNIAHLESYIEYIFTIMIITVVVAVVNNSYLSTYRYFLRQICPI